MAIVTPYSNITALIIDDMAVQQTTLRGQLASLGITKVEQTMNAEDAIKLIRTKRYGLIMCDYNLNNKTDGQQFFEYLRDNALLPSDCLFFMVTAESAYASVAAATEHLPDAYMLKPITASDIEDRLKALLDKRQALSAVNQCLDRKDWQGAIDACNVLLQTKGRWTMAAYQNKTHALLQLGKHEDAKAVYREILEDRPQLIWAQLGLARAFKAAGQFEEAKTLAQDIIQSAEGAKNVAAYDIVAEALEAQGDSQGALWVLRDCAQVVPSARRHRQVGECAFRNGDLDTAKECYTKVTKATKGSAISLPQDTLVLAQTLVDKGEAADALKVLAEAANFQRNNPAYEQVSLSIQTQAQVKTGDVKGAKDSIVKARATMRKSKADFATVALAKAEIMTGHEEAGLKLMGAAISADHENPRIKQMIANALRDTGHDDKLQQIIDGPAAELQLRVKDARALLRESKFDEAMSAIETAVQDFPENTGVLLQAAQINCLALRLKKERNQAVVDRVQLYLSRLEKLLPANDRVTQMRRYLRETLTALEESPVTH